MTPLESRLTLTAKQIRQAELVLLVLISRHTLRGDKKTANKLRESFKILHDIYEAIKAEKAGDDDDVQGISDKI